MFFLSLLLSTNILSYDLFAQDISFSFEFDSTIIYTDENSIGSFNGVLQNISSSDLELLVVKNENQFSEGWSSSICINNTCYPVNIDTIEVNLSVNSSTDLLLEIFTNGIGTGKVGLDLFEKNDLNEHFLINLDIYTENNLSFEEVKYKSLNSVSSYPNPFNQSTFIKLETGFKDVINLSIYNVKGEYVEGIKNIKVNKGINLIKLNGENHFGRSTNSGIYYISLVGEYLRENIEVLYLK